MAKIVIVGDDPITSRIMAYMSIDGGRELKLKYADSPHQHSIEPGAHSFFISTSSPLQRNLASARDGDFLSTLGNMLNDVESGTWNGTIDLDEDDVLLIYIEVKITKSIIHINVTDEEGANSFLSSIENGGVKKSKGVTPWKVIKTIFIVIICISLVTGAIQTFYHPTGSKQPTPQTNADTGNLPQDVTASVAEDTTEYAPDAAEAVDPDDSTMNTVMYITADIGLNLRTEPDINSSAIIVMPYGEQVIVREIRGEWSNVQFGDLQGWCANRYLYSENSKKGVPNDYISLYKTSSEDSEIVVSIGTNDVVTIISEDGDWLYVKLESYYTGTTEAGWCRRDKIGEDAGPVLPVFTGELTVEAAQELLRTYSSATLFPYYTFLQMRILNFEDQNKIYFDDGSVAAVSYTAEGIESVSDLLSFYRNFCSERLVCEMQEYMLNSDHSTGYRIIEGKLYFNPNYAMGAPYIFAQNVTYVGNNVYKVAVHDGESGYDSTYAVIFEDGRYKVDGYVMSEE